MSPRNVRQMSNKYPHRIEFDAQGDRGGKSTVCPSPSTCAVLTVSLNLAKQALHHWL